MGIACYSTWRLDLAKSSNRLRKRKPGTDYADCELLNIYKSEKSR